jgi:hypothetical protein
MSYPHLTNFIKILRNGVQGLRFQEILQYYIPFRKMQSEILLILITTYEIRTLSPI